MSEIPKNPKDIGEDSIGELKEGLYSRQDYFSAEKTDKAKRRVLKKHEYDVAEDWASGPGETGGKFYDPARRLIFWKRLFIASLAFFFVSVGIALYIFLGGANIISSKNVDIVVTGPVSVQGGGIFGFDVLVDNQNNNNLESTDLVVEYPEGAREAENVSRPLKRYRELLGTIAKGARAEKKFQAILFGEEGAMKEIKISIEYRVNGSNAIFSKNKIYAVSIGSAPVTMKIAGASELNSGQDADFVLEITSNSSSVIENLAVSSEYPFGFSFISADPKPSFGNGFWRLGDLKPGAKRTIKVHGTLVGQDNDSRTFHFGAGTEDPQNENVIGTNFLSSSQQIIIRKPFLGISFVLDGDARDNHIAKPGSVIRADITVVNDLADKITDLKIKAKPTGPIFGYNSVFANNGFFRASDNTIVWDQTLVSALNSLEPAGNQTVSFSFSTLTGSEIQNIKNPEMTFEISASGTRINERGVSETVSSSISRNVRMTSVFGLSTRLLYSSGPFTNSGPLPPKVNLPTSYTAVWSLTNTSNDLSNVRVYATLPSYVKWQGVIKPTDEKLSYNPVNGQIVWDVGELKAGTGFAGSPREVNFQISFIPGINQAGTIPALVGQATASGDDAFADTSLQVIRGPLNTSLSTDPNFKDDQAVVVR